MPPGAACPPRGVPLPARYIRALACTDPARLTIWPAHERQDWPPASLAGIGGPIALARSLDAGIDIAL